MNDLRIFIVLAAVTLIAVFSTGYVLAKVVNLDTLYEKECEKNRELTRQIDCNAAVVYSADSILKENGIFDVRDTVWFNRLNPELNGN